MNLHPGAELAPLAAPPPLSVRANLVWALREAIQGGALKPGEKLSDGKLCETFGVSRTSMREALRQLESERLITVMGNRRACVARLQPREVDTIYALLAQLMGDAAALLAARMDLRITRAMGQMRYELAQYADAGDAANLRAQLMRFHMLVLNACTDTVRREISFQLLTRTGYLQNRALAETGWRTGSKMAITAIAMALEAREAQHARQAAQNYFRAEAQAVAQIKP